MSGEGLGSRAPPGGRAALTSLWHQGRAGSGSVKGTVVYLSQGSTALHVLCCRAELSPPTQPSYSCARGALANISRLEYLPSALHFLPVPSLILGSHTPSASGPFSALTPSMWPQEILAKYTQVQFAAWTGPTQAAPWVEPMTRTGWGSHQNPLGLMASQSLCRRRG